jgi:hypothetical protein
MAVNFVLCTGSVRRWILNQRRVAKYLDYEFFFGAPVFLSQRPMDDDLFIIIVFSGSCRAVLQICSLPVSSLPDPGPSFHSRLLRLLLRPGPILSSTYFSRYNLDRFFWKGPQNFLFFFVYLHNLYFYLATLKKIKFIFINSGVLF